MKYGKLINNNLDIKEIEKGMEVGGTATEQQIVGQGYKPVCGVEEPEGAEYFVYREYDACFVQEWRMKDEPLQEGDIWTSESVFLPSFSDIKRVKEDVSYIEGNINAIPLSDGEALEVRNFYPSWEAGIEVPSGYKCNYGGGLWKAVQPHKTQTGWEPSLDTASLWQRIEEQHAGTKEDPIPFAPPMGLEEGKYYAQEGVTYECIRGSGGVGIAQDLSDVVGIYVKVVDLKTGK